MDNLMCDEVLDFSPLMSSPSLSPPAVIDEKFNDAQRLPIFLCSKNDFEEAIGFLIEKEMSFMPKPGYSIILLSNSFICNARSKAIRWIIECHKRLNISMETVFYAANYFDRFISFNKCHVVWGWRCCTFDLLAVACLYVATKFNETHPPSLHALQMEGLRHSPFGSNRIGWMEITLLEALGWKLMSTTPYSYLQLMETLQEELKSRATNMLLQALLDPKFLEFRPSFVAEAALRCTVKEIHPPENDIQYFHHFTALIPQDQKDDMMKKKCDEMMEKELREEEMEITRTNELCGRCPVLMSLEQLAAELNIYDDDNGSTRKRKRLGYCY